MFDLFAGASRALWNQGQSHVRRKFMPSPPGMAHLKSEFEHALSGVETPESLRLRARILSSRSKLDLWHLRTDVFGMVSHAMGQWEAQSRLADLNELFESSGPRTGPIPL